MHVSAHRSKKRTAWLKGTVRVLTFVVVFTSLNFAPPLQPKAAKAATYSNAKLDFDLADESGFIQENSAKTSFVGGLVDISSTTVVGGVTAVGQVVSTGAFSTVWDALSVPETGTITSWRVYATTSTTLKLKVYQKNGSNNYTSRGDSSNASVSNGVNGPFSTSISVIGGDVLGLFGNNNPVTSTGGSGFFGWKNVDFTGTSSFTNSSNNAHRHPNIEFTLSSHSTTQPYYVTTNDATQLKVKHWTDVNSISITQTTPASTSILYLISFDDRVTWKYWNGASWAASSLANLQSQGMTKATLEALDSADWAASGGFVTGTTPTIDVAFDLSTSNPSNTPSVDQISFSYETAVDTSLDYDAADEGDYIQENAAGGTDFADGVVRLTGTPGFYPTNTPYYVTTSDANQIDTSDWTVMGGLRLTQTTPTFTSMKYMLSFDDRATWKVWGGSSWTAQSLGSIDTYGNTATTLEALTWDDFEASGGFIPGSTTKLDIAVMLKTTSNSATPSLDQITIEFTPPAIPPVPTNDATLDNSITLSRSKKGVTADLAVRYTLVNEKDGTLTVTLPVGFAVTGAFQTGSCAGGGTIASFGFNGPSRTLTAEKDNCSGAVTLSGAAVTNPSTPGLYMISWVNDDPGEGGVAIVDDDQVTVTAQVNASITFDIDTATTDTESAAPYAVVLGAITPTDTRVSGTTDSVNYIWLDIDTNASSGAVITVKSANGANGLASTSVPGDDIDSATGAVADGLENYGICSVSETDSGGNLDDIAPFDGTCAADTEGNTVGGFDGTAQPIYDTDADPIAAGRARVAVQASISPTTAAHNDYTDTLTFIATGTF